jgi:hypothetical protein
VRRDTLDEVNLAEARVQESPHDGQQCWKLAITPKDSTYAPEALERTYLVVSSANVNLTPGSQVKISGWYRIPQPIRSSADGLLIYDNAAGEAMGVRLYHSPQWKKMEVYRTVPSSGQVNVSIALTGMGVAYFDDLKIEALQANSVTVPGKVPNKTAAK